ncbi:MAG: orotidine-5'-phosphate decarboxylase [Verrucomicrobiota bacterium]|nr:orotidine-5'-phosphate decarboxylase [Verrucomicrobiota bacterium]
MNSTHIVKNPRDRLIVALDFPEPSQGLDLVCDLARDVAIFKVGLQLFTAGGPEIVRAITATGAKVFLDLKLHDIPNTVARAVAAAGKLGVSMLTLHLAGGRQMIAAAVAECPPDLLLLGVTVLTSADETMLREIGVDAGVSDHVVRLAQLGVEAGIGGLIASPHEVRMLRAGAGEKLVIITPGIRPSGAVADDQKRFTTPQEAVELGADYLVIGRPITANPEPREAVQRIIAELEA